MQPYKIDIVIGPIDRLDDHVFFKKTSYEAWVGIVDEEKTEKAKMIQKAIYDAKRKTLAPSEKAEFLDKTHLRVINFCRTFRQRNVYFNQSSQ